MPDTLYSIRADGSNSGGECALLYLGYTLFRAAYKTLLPTDSGLKKGSVFMFDDSLQLTGFKNYHHV